MNHDYYFEIHYSPKSICAGAKSVCIINAESLHSAFDKAKQIYNNGEKVFAISAIRYHELACPLPAKHNKSRQYGQARYH